MRSERPVIVGVGGFTSEVGKTTLLCELLQALPGWEAIKTTRGNYRSCGKDPHACCVSHLLQDEPVIRSGRELDLRIKPTARRALSRVSAIYLSGETDAADLGDSQYIDEFLLKSRTAKADGDWPVFTHERLPQLVNLLRELDGQAAA